MPRRRHLFLSLILTALVAASATGQTNEQAPTSLTSEFDISLRVRDGGDVEVGERITLRGDLTGRRLTRNLWMGEAPGAWPLQQRVDRVSIHDETGKPLAHRTRRYAEHINIDLLELAPVIEIRYRLWRGSDLRGELGRIEWTLAGIEWGATLTRAEVHIEVEGVAEPKRAGLSYTVGYSANEAITPEPRRQGSSVAWTIDGPIAPDDPVSVAIEHERGNLSEPPAAQRWTDLYQLGRHHFWIAGAVFFLAMLMLLVPAHMAVRMTAWLNFAGIIPAAWVAYHATAFWVFEGQFRDASDNLAGEAVVNFGLVAFVFGYAWRQRRLLMEHKRAAYFAQLGVPVALLVCTPLAFVSRDMLFFPLVGLPLYVHWWRPSIAVHFGVGSYRIAELITTSGQLPIAEVCRRFSITEAQLTDIVGAQPTLPFVLDRKAGTALSAESAAMQKQLRVCPQCGGATSVASMASIKCDYCDREYASSKRAKPRSPVPVVVESVAMLMRSLGIANFAFAVVIGFGILTLEIAGGSLLDGVIGAAIATAILLIPAALLLKLSDKLMQGRMIGWCRLAMLALAPLIAPLVIAIKLGSRRVKLFTGKLEAKSLDDELQKRGQWPIPEFARYLGASPEEATELAGYLTTSEKLDGVFERAGRRLVSRALYREVALSGSCRSCGGFYGVVGADVACHYCHQLASEASPPGDDARPASD